MRLKHLRRMALLSLHVALLSLVPTAPANAGIFTGTCVLNVTFQFFSPVNGTTSAPSYSVSISPSAADFDPLWSGTQPCAVSGDVSPARTTVGGGSGSSTIWSCGAVLASGDWDQSWFNRSGNAGPPSLNGSHTITGTWDNWEMVVRNPSLSFTGNIHLTLSPFENSKALGCAGGGITSLTMIGVMVFQDPEVP